MAEVQRLLYVENSFAAFSYFVQLFYQSSYDKLTTGSDRSDTIKWMRSWILCDANKLICFVFENVLSLQTFYSFEAT